MPGTAIGLIDWELEMTEIGHRNYTSTWLVECTDPRNDGPMQAVNAAGLPNVGDSWIYGNENDFWALCWPNFKARPVLTHEPNHYWTVEVYFSTQPIRRCMDTQIENPLLEPYKISGGSIARTKIPKIDMNGNPIVNSAQQLLSGPELEFDENRPTYRVSWNQLLNPGPLAAAMVDTVNITPMWGYPARCIKLNNFSFQRNLWGTCNFYFTSEYELGVMYDPFDVDPYGNPLGWDRLVPDQGNRVLQGWSPAYWLNDPCNPTQKLTPPLSSSTQCGQAQTLCGYVVNPACRLDPEAIDPTTGKKNYLNPSKYEAYKMDTDGEITSTFLYHGTPVTDISQAGQVFIQYYPGNNLFLLGLPVDLDVNAFPTF